MKFNKRAQALTQIFLLIGMAFAVSYMIYSSTPVVAQSTLSEPSFCCEKTKEGGLCINSDEANCDEGRKSSPTSCETTSYCKLGTCYDSEEGICMENTPQTVCDENGGTWDERDSAEIPQCQLGCCVIADQAAFVPLVRCKRLSTLFGVENDYRTDIYSEVDCIATAQSQDMGACVYESDYERICEFTTKGECGAGNEVQSTDINGTEELSISSQKKFYKDYLCSAEELNTVCARQTKTNCYQEQVYWFDSCGNRENVYSSDREISWNNGRVLDGSAICSPNDGSDKNCGNCDYLLGSRCAEWDGLLGLGKPDGSDYYCKDNSCVDREDNDRKNGESWCVHDNPSGESNDPVGALYYRELCVDGEVVVEPCADFRKEICLEGAIEIEGGDYGTAACRVNRWQECLAIKDQEDCNNSDRRDCLWLPPVIGMVLGNSGEGEKSFSNPTSDDESFSNPTATGSVIAPITGHGIFGGDDEEEEPEEETTTNRPGGICVPQYTPGQNFWEDGEAPAICGQANAKCIVEYEEGLLGGRKCVENCECLEDDWAEGANRICSALGDCGGYINYKGTYTEDGYKWTHEGEKKKFAPSVVNQMSEGITGLVVGGPITGISAVIGNFLFGGLVFVSGLTQAQYEAQVAELRADQSVNSLDFSENNLLFNGNELPDVAEPVINPVVKPSAIQNPASGSSVLTNGKIATGIGSSAQKIIMTKSMEFTTVGGKQILISKGTVVTPAAGGGGTVVGPGGGIHHLTAADIGKFTTPYVETGGSSYLSSMLGGEGILTGGAMDSLLTGVQWAAIAYGVGMLVGSMVGLDKDNTQALSLALAGGAFVWKALATSKWAGTVKLFGGTTLQSAALPIGIGVAAAIFIIMYKTTETEVVEFQCMPWQAPTGGNECEVCNEEGLPCTEYRCRSLGQNCELVNGGSSQEKCVNVNPHDVDQPIITPNKNELTMGYRYTDVRPNPPNAGFEITRIEGENKCIKAFTPLKFGITINEPAQCKIDFNHTTSFDDMRTFMGGNNLYLYNHSENFILPGTDAFANSSFVLENGNEMNFFIRCRDKNGNENSAEYVARFCIDPSPDNTAPQIKATSIDNGGCVAADTSFGVVEFYTNEPAECKWSHEDRDYDSMSNEMICNNQLYQLNALQLFTCSANLTGIARDETQFYVRCKDQPGKEENDRNENAESFKFNLRGSGALKLKNLKPNGTIYGAVNPAPVELYVQTLFGCSDGQSVCYYSLTGEERDYVMFYDTDKDDGIHTQRLDLGAGVHEIFVKCVDSGGNVAIESTEFTLDIDINAPVVARVYEQDELLKIVTVRDSECVYSMTDCDFTFDEGTVMPYANSTNHVIDWNEDKTYYIKCRDEFRNEEADCSIIVRPTVNFL